MPASIRAEAATSQALPQARGQHDGHLFHPAEGHSAEGRGGIGDPCFIPPFDQGHAGYSVYNATKAAVRSLVRTAVSELQASDIRVNTLSPGPVETPIIKSEVGLPEAAAKFRRRAAAVVPMGRLGRPQELAAAAFIASDESGFSTDGSGRRGRNDTALRWPDIRKLAGKTAIVTGTSKGIGAATAVELVAEGERPIDAGSEAAPFGELCGHGATVSRRWVGCNGKAGSAEVARGTVPHRRAARPAFV